jgi:hypothetical protein
MHTTAQETGTNENENMKKSVRITAKSRKNTWKRTKINTISSDN